MISIKKVKSLKRGKGIQIRNKSYAYMALVVADVSPTSDHIRLVSENSGLVRPKFENYGKTWWVEAIN